MPTTINTEKTLEKKRKSIENKAGGKKICGPFVGRQAKMLCRA